MITTRRNLLNCIVATTACCALPHAAFTAHDKAPTVSGTVDVHQHFYPKFLMDAWAAAPLEGDWSAYKALFMAAPYTGWTPDGAVAQLDANGTGTAVLSLPAGAIGFLRGQELAAMTRRVNEYATRVAHDRPGRFGLFALLPMPYITASLAEITHALDTLGATGIAMMTSYGNRWLGHPDFDPVLEELNWRKAVVHVHPKAPTCCTNLVQSIPRCESSLLEFRYDTGRALFDLLQSGALMKYPNIQWIFSHLGGLMPMLAGRLRDVGPGFWKDFDRVAPRGIDHEFQRLHYDTAALSHEPSVRAALAYVPAANLLFGSDQLHCDVDRTVGNFAHLAMPIAIKQAIQLDNPRRFLTRLQPWHG